MRQRHRPARLSALMIEEPTMTVTPTHLPGLKAAFVRRIGACIDAMWRIPAWHGVSVVMACAAGAMVFLAPTPLLA